MSSPILPSPRPGAYRAVKTVHRPFAVGRLSKHGCLVVVIERLAPSPIFGPWELRAIVSTH